MSAHRTVVPSLLAALWLSAAPHASAQVVAAAEASAVNPRVLVRATRRIEVRTDLQAKVARLPFREGMAFAKGEVLVDFDCRRQRAELASVRAAAAAARTELAAKRQMHRHGAAGRTEVDLARAELRRAQADVKARDTRIADCTIAAPFPGRVVRVHGREHEMPPAGEAVITVLDDRDLELELVLPSRWLTWLKPGAGFSIRIDETGTQHAASIVRVGAEVDAVSQTVRAFGRIDGTAGGVLAGMSGHARFLHRDR